LLLLITFIVFTGWQAGLETVYAKLVVSTTNYTLDVIKDDTRIEYKKKSKTSKDFEFVVFTRIDGRKGNYPQEVGGILQPFVIILSWQIFLFFVLKRRQAFQSLGVNFAIYLFVQILFLFLLTGYYNSTVQEYFFTMMLDSFYILSLILIIKDNMLYPVFRKKVIVKGNQQ